MFHKQHVCSAGLTPGRNACKKKVRHTYALIRGTRKQRYCSLWGVDVSMCTTLGAFMAFRLGAAFFSEPVHDDDVQEDGVQAGLVTRSETQTVEVQLMRAMSSYDPILESAWGTEGRHRRLSSRRE